MRLSQREGEDSLVELKEIILQTIHIRRVTLGIFLVIAVVLRFGASFNFPLPLIFSPLMWGLTTYPYEKLIRTRKSKVTLNNIHFWYFILEILILTYLIHILGGAEWIGIAYYLFSVIYANFFLPPKKAWAVTGLAVVLFGVMSYGEYKGWIPHWSLFPNSIPRYKDPLYLITTIFAGGVGIYLTIAFTVQMFARIFREKNESLEERREKMELLWKRLIRVREKERKRIASKLHDDLNQILMATKMKLDVIEKEENYERLDEVGDYLAEAIEESRNLSHQLRPSVLDELGLSPAIRELLEDFSSSAEIEVESFIVPDLDPERKEIKIIIYRAVQELLNNAVNHGDPEKVEVSLKREDEGLLVRVEDDGQGFDPRSVPKKSGLGLKGIEENVNMVGGQFDIDSGPGEGTSARIEIPL